jgi:hypothetical protein
MKYLGPQLPIQYSRMSFLFYACISRYNLRQAMFSLVIGSGIACETLQIYLPRHLKQVADDDSTVYRRQAILYSIVNTPSFSLPPLQNGG